MIFNMHCRSSYPTNPITHPSSFLFVHSNYTNHCNDASTSSRSDQVRTPSGTRRRQHRRRLEDPVITYASNYYATYSHQILHSPPPSPQSPSFLTGRRTGSKSAGKNAYCDLYNLLECPPTAKQRRKYLSNDVTRRCSIDYGDTHGKMKHSLKRDRHQQEHRDRSTKKAKANDRACQEHFSCKGFFRRVACNYLCMLRTDTHGEISN